MSNSFAEILQRLSEDGSGRGAFVIQSGNLTITSGCTATYQPTSRNLIITSGHTEAYQSTIIINGKQYDANDPNSVLNMTQSDREIFWISCTNNAKNSDLYRAYAASVLKEVNMSLDSFDSQELNALLTNNATNIRSLLKEWVKFKIEQPDVKLKNIEPTYLPLFLKHSSDLLKLMKGLQSIGYQDLLNLILSFDLEKLTTLVNNYYNVLEVIKRLHELGIQDPLNYLIKMKSETAKLLIGDHYNCFEVVKGFGKLGYPNALDKLLNLPKEQSALLRGDHYNCFEVMSHLERLEYSDPFQTFISLPKDRDLPARLCDKVHMIL